MGKTIKGIMRGLKGFGRTKAGQRIRTGYRVAEVSGGLATAGYIAKDAVSKHKLKKPKISNTKAKCLQKHSVPLGASKEVQYKKLRAFNKCMKK